MLHTLGNVNEAGQKYCLTQAMPFVILLHILLFSLSKSFFLYIDQKKVQSSFYKFDLLTTSLSLQKKSENHKKDLGLCYCKYTRSINKDNFEYKRLFLK